MFILGVCAFNLNLTLSVPSGDLRGVAGGDRVRDAAVRWGDGGEHQAAAAAPRGDPQAAHAPTTWG